MTRHEAMHPGRWALIFGGFAAAIYCLMIFGTLAQLVEMSALAPFDMRPGGYSALDAEELLQALGAEGRAYYLTRQIPLDLVYPALLAMTLVAAFQWVGRHEFLGRIVTIGMWLAIAAAVLDYLENAGIVSMILLWPDVPAFVVATASITSMAKAGMTTAAVVLLLMLVVLRIWRVGWR